MSNFYGLLGEKLGHSLSPEIHSLILEKINKSGAYNLFELKKINLCAALKGLKALEAKGVNVTIPYKVDILEYMDKLSPEAEKIGAVNTISFNNDVLTGYNTDYFGFGEALKKAGIEASDKSIMILGTGGASKAVLQYLIDNKAKEIICVSRKPEKNVINAKNIRVGSYDELNSIGTFDIIINCTPVGMYPSTEASPISKDVLKNFSAAVDLIYNPRKTLFLREAESIGMKTINGLYMLVAQAVAAQEIWNGIKISSEIQEEIYNIIENRFYGD